MKSPHERQMSTPAITPTRPKRSSTKPSRWRKSHLDLIGARIITDLDASELRSDLGIPSVIIPQEVYDILAGDLDFKRKTRRCRLGSLATTLIALSYYLDNDFPVSTLDFVQALLEYLSPEHHFPPWKLSLQIGELQELWSPLRLMAGLLAVVEVKRPTSEFAEETAYCLSVAQYARARMDEKELLCANGKLVSWVLSVRPGKVFAVAAMFGHGMFEQMERTAVDMVVSGRAPVRGGIRGGPDVAVLKWDLRSMAGRVGFTDFIASLLKHLDGIGMPAPETTASSEEDI